MQKRVSLSLEISCAIGSLFVINGLCMYVLFHVCMYYSMYVCIIPCMYYSMYVSINANSSYVIVAFANI